MQRLNLSEVRPGMTLARTVINENLIVVLAENTFLTQAHIEKLQFLGITNVYVKDAYDLSPQNSIVKAMLSRSHAFASDYQEVLSVAEELFKTAEKTQSLPVQKTKSMIQESVSPLIRQSGVIDYLYELKHTDKSVYNHSLRVSILAGVLAKWMQYDEAAMQDVTLAGFLHDIGKTQIDQNIVERDVESLTPEEMEIYMQHTINGYHLLSANAELSEGVKKAALQHHEKTNGSGFPFNALSADIHDYAKIVALADFYDIVTTEREGFPKYTPFSAIAMITQKMFGEMDPKICMPFLVNIQQAFLGSTVLLSDKRRGVIIQYPKDYAAMPLISMEDDEIIDLNKNANLRIVEYNPPASLSF